MCVCVFVHFCNFYGLFLENDIIVCSDFGHKFSFSFSLYSCCYVLFLPYLIVRGWAWDVGRHVCWRNGNEECQVSSKGILTLSMISFCLSLLLLSFHNTFFFLPFLSPSLPPSHPPSFPPSVSCYFCNWYQVWLPHPRNQVLHTAHDISLSRTVHVYMYIAYCIGIQCTHYTTIDILLIAVVVWY